MYTEKKIKNTCELYILYMSYIIVFFFIDAHIDDCYKPH